ncbi:TPA: Natural resistance-associated macrophage protein, variant 2 [Trebouxia sp. C0006]
MAQKEPEKSADKLELDALLDDALNDFETDQPDTSGRPPSSSSSAPAQTDRQGPAPSKGKGLAFDPLQKPKGKRVHTHPPAPATAAAAGPFGGFGGGFGAIPPDIADQDDISAGFQRMMAELAQVDLSQRQTPRPMAEPPIPGDHDLAATLRALAAKSSSFGGGANAQGGALVPDGLNSDMLNKLTEQLNALGEAATGGVPGGQEGSSEDMSGLVDGIMHQLLAKDVLYQPIQEIGARYPQWLTDHRYTPPVSGYTSVLPVLLLLVTPLGGGFLSQLLVLTLL